MLRSSYCAIYCLLVFTGTSLAQETQTDLADFCVPLQQTSIRIALNGEAQPSSYTGYDYVVLPYHRLLSCESIHEELDLIPDQIKKIESLISKDDSRKLEIIKKRTRNGFDQSVLNEVGKLQKEFTGELEEILLEHQLESLRQIANRVKLRRNGLTQYFSTRVDGLPKSKLNELDMSINNMKQEFAARNRAACLAALESIVSPLSKKQLDQLEAMGAAPESCIKNLEFLVLDLERALDEENRDLDGQLTGMSLFELMRKRGGYFVQDDGSWGQLDFSKSIDAVLAEELANKLIPRKDEQPTFEIERLQDLRWAVEVLKDERAAIRQRVQELREYDVKEEVVFEFRQEQLRNQLNVFLKAFHQILSDDETDQLKSHFRRLVIRSNLLSSLLLGDLGDELELTKSQRREIKDRAKVELEKATQELRNWESDILTFTLDLMELDENQPSFDFGPQMKHTTPSLLLLFRHD